MRLRIDIAKHYRWHGWFAWHPIWVSGCIVWLEKVNRRRYVGSWEYQLL